MIGLGSCLVLWLAGLAFVPAATPAAVDSEMVLWAAARVPAGPPAERRLALLHRALVQRGGLALADSDRTATARQAFAHLYVGLARRLGLPVYFLLARGLEKQGTKKDLRVLEGHMAVGWGDPAKALVIDAEGIHRADFRRFERIGDAVAGAIFASNRGVEALLDGKGPQAVAWLEQAIRQAPGLAPLWANLGVARRRTGDLRGAALALAEAHRLGAPAPRASR